MQSEVGYFDCAALVGGLAPSDSQSVVTLYKSGEAGLYDIGWVITVRNVLLDKRDEAVM